MKIGKLILILLLSSRFMGSQAQELESLKASLPGIKDSLHYADALNRLALLLYEQNVDSTFLLTKQAREIAIRHNYFKGKIDALNNLGAVYFVKGNNQLAFRYFNEACQGYRSLKDTGNVVQTLMNIGTVYRYMGKEQKALSNLRAALQAGVHLRKDSIMALAIANYVAADWDYISRDSAARYIQKAKKITLTYRDTRVSLALDELVALNFMKANEPEKGINYLGQTINRTMQKHLFFYSAGMSADLGDLLIGKDSGRAVAYYRQGLNIAQQRNFFTFSQAITQKLILFYQQHGNKDLELKYSRMQLAFHAKQDSIDKASGIDYIEYAVKDQQVQTLQQKSEYQLRLLLMSIAVGVLAIIVLVAIGLSLKRTKRLNSQIREQNGHMTKTLGALEQSQADNTKMMQIVAHDLRNPIGGMYSIALLMLDNPERSEDDRTMLELIKLSADNSLTLVSDLLQVHIKVEELKKEPVDLDRMLHYCVNLLENKAVAKGQQISLSSQQVIVPANREKLWRVVSNLIANAIKFSPTGAKITVSLDMQSDGALICVKDHGIGIPDQMKDKIFDMFTEAKRPGTAGEQPFGLGMAISKQIVEAHGGKIWFESNPDRGTTFFVKMPY